MPQFNTPGSLEISFADKAFGDSDFSYNTLTLLGDVPAEAQIIVRWETIQYIPYVGGPTLSVSGEAALSSANLDAFRSITNATFASGEGITFNEESKSIQVDAPVSVTIPEPITYNSQEYSELFYVSPPQISTVEPVTLRRSTNVSSPTVTFQPGSRLTSKSLNASRDQNLFAIQELTEFGALSEGGSGGGGGSFGGSIWEISGANFLNPTSSSDGVVIWQSDNLISTYDADGVMPLTTGTVTGSVLLTDPTAGNVTNTAWTPLSVSIIDAGGVPLDAVLVALDAKAAFFEDTGNGLLVNGGDADRVEVESTNIVLDGLVTVEGDLVAPTINGAAPLNADSVLSDLDDVTAPAPSEGEFLVYDSASSQWVNRTPAINGVTPPSVYIQNREGATVVGSLDPSGQPYPLLFLWNTVNYPDLKMGGDPSMTAGLDVGSGGKGWISPFKGRVEVLAQAVWNTAITSSQRTNVWFQVRKTSADGSTEVIDGTNYSTPENVSASNNISVASSAVIDVEIGDSVMYVMGRGDIGDGAAITRYHAATITRLDFDATLYASEVIEADIVNTPSGAIAVEQRVGVTDEGKPVYCQTRRWNGGFVVGATTLLWSNFYVGRQLISVEPILLNDTNAANPFLSESAHALYGFEITEDGDDIRVSRIASPTISSDCGPLSYGHYNVFYTKDSDVAQPTMTVVPTGTIKALESVYYIECSVQDQISVATANEAKRTYGNSSQFNNTGISVNYGTAQTSDWNQTTGIWTCPVDGLYEVSTQFGLNQGTDTQAMSYVEANPGSGFVKLGTNFHMRGLDPGTGDVTQRLYMSSYQVIREFQQGTQVRVMFENSTGSGASSMDIENAKASIRKIGPYTS